MRAKPTATLSLEKVPHSTANKGCLILKHLTQSKILKCYSYCALLIHYECCKTYSTESHTPKDLGNILIQIYSWIFLFSRMKIQTSLDTLLKKATETILGCCKSKLCVRSLTTIASPRLPTSTQTSRCGKALTVIQTLCMRSNNFQLQKVAYRIKHLTLKSPSRTATDSSGMWKETLLWRRLTRLFNILRRIMNLDLVLGNFYMDKHRNIDGNCRQKKWVI